MLRDEPRRRAVRSGSKMAGTEAADIRVLVFMEGPAGPALCRALAAWPGVVAADLAIAGSSAAAIPECRAPDVILLDLDAKPGAATVAAQRLHGLLPEASVLLLSWYLDARARFAVALSGAAGCVQKDLDLQPLRAALLAREGGSARNGTGVPAA
jgi:DNA-binding NarL/FixJ family response regulator